MLVLVRYERGNLRYTHCHIIASHKLGRCGVRTSRCGWHMRKSSHNQKYASEGNFSANNLAKIMREIIENFGGLKSSHSWPSAIILYSNIR